MPSSLTFVMERAGLPNASVLASNKLANPGCGREQHQESAGEGRTFMQVGLAVAAAAGIH